MAASYLKLESEHLCFHRHSRGTGDSFSPPEKVRGTPVSLGSSPLGRHRRELSGRLIPQLSSWHRGDPGSLACAGDGPSAAQRQAGTPGTAEHLAVAAAAGTL